MGRSKRVTKRRSMWSKKELVKEKGEDEEDSEIEEEEEREVYATRE